MGRLEIARYGDGHDYDGSGYRVTAGMADMERAGWVVLGPVAPIKTAWMLTDTGRALLRGEPWTP